MAYKIDFVHFHFFNKLPAKKNFFLGRNQLVNYVTSKKKSKITKISKISSNDGATPILCSAVYL